ncbi:MAG: LPS export ABC transporter periplasmic protein LptC [Candidatus Omnitrophica bacterium CG1_02_46_14]|nr:MAG: LPS export ABC transporter periplasmic protein LptC [Candidatus Omnitrophica bacterium CG1_02_46_14]
MKIFLAGCICTALFSVFFLMHEKNAKKEAVLMKRARSHTPPPDTDQSLQKFSLTGFDDEGKKFWNLQGDKAKIDTGQTIFLEQNVTLKLKESTVIKTDHVQWSQDGGILRTRAMVTVSHENAEVKGRGAVGRLSENFIQLNHDIEMLINKSTLLTCDGPLKIFIKENKMVFYRKVKVVDDRGVLTANRMDVLFDPEQKKVSQIIAIGNVTIERGTDTTHSQRAIYSLVTGSVRLEGNPEVTLHKESAKMLDAPFRN